MTGTLQQILDWSRFFIGDRKTKTVPIRGEEIGRIATPTGQRESFYVPHSPIGSLFLYVEPYKYSAVSTFSGSSSNDKHFLWKPATLLCTFPDGSIDLSVRPKKFRPVLAYYEYEEDLPYIYTDNELISFFPAALEMLNNVYDKSYTYTGTISTFSPSVSNGQEKQLFALSLAVVVRENYVTEKQARGWGVRFRGPMQLIDSTQTMKEYIKQTSQLRTLLDETINSQRFGSDGEAVDLYSENVVG